MDNWTLLSNKMNTFINLILVFLGGGIGSVFRYLIGKLLLSNSNSFPWGTFLANLAGCFLLGFFSNWLIKNYRSEWMIFFTIGVCGGLTTFSTFSNEALIMLKNQNWLLFLKYSISSFTFGLIMIKIGYDSIKFFRIFIDFFKYN